MSGSAGRRIGAFLTSRPIGAASETRTDAPSPLIDKVKAQFTSPYEANEIDFIFRVCQDAQSCADAGRAFYGTGKNRNYPDVFKKRLAHFGLAFDKSAPGHLSLRPAASQAK